MLFVCFLGLILFHPIGLNKVMTNKPNQSMSNEDSQSEVAKIDQAKKLNAEPEESTKNVQVAYFAGGCFWCMEPVFDPIHGVMNTTVGYMGGKKETANYSAVSSGSTQHYEVVQVTYDANLVSYKTLLDAFWQSIDPTDALGQFADKGRHYQTVIFIKDDSDQVIIDASISDLLAKKSYDKPIATKVLPEQIFYEAEEYHQNYYQKNAVQYQAYKVGSGREMYLNQAWGKSTDK